MYSPRVIGLIKSQSSKEVRGYMIPCSRLYWTRFGASATDQEGIFLENVPSLKAEGFNKSNVLREFLLSFEGVGNRTWVRCVDAVVFDC